MSESCPDCGSVIEYASRPATLKNGHCGSCGQDFTFLRTTEGIEIPAAPAGASPASESAEGESEDSEEEVGLPCKNCGADLELSLGAGGAIEATCPACGSVQRFVPERAGMDRERGERPEAGRGMREGPEGAPRARPCRECGGPLKFTTLPDGMVQGECASCGNKFVLPPRRDRGERRDYGGRTDYRPRGGRRGPPRYDGRRNQYRPDRRPRESSY